MPNPKISEDTCRTSIEALEQSLRDGFRRLGSPSATDHAARLLGISRSTLGDRLRRGKDLYGLEPNWSLETETTLDPNATAQIVGGLESEISSLQARIRSLSQDQITRDHIRRHLLDLKEYDPKPPRWSIKRKKRTSITGTPILFASDWQLGEVIRAEEINNYNAFDLEIAEDRIERMMQKCIRLLFDEVANPEYPGIYFLLGGDMVSGDTLHDDLTRTNEERALPTLLRLVDLLVGCVDTLLEHFEYVHIPCVPGNHGRLDKKPPSKERNVTNLDWLAGVMLERHYTTLMECGALEKGRVTFQIDNSPDTYFRIYDRTYCLTHGDQFRGGDGLIGPIGPVMRGRWKKSGRDVAMGQPFDTMCCGHFHWLMQLDHLIINGSLPGYSEFAYLNNMQPTRPAQALWIQHPDEGITHQMPIYLDD
jgi:hypothetical protein